MDIQKLQKGQELLKQSEATERVMKLIQKLDKQSSWSSDEGQNLLIDIYSIRNEMIQKLIELKADYERDFAAL